MKKFLHCCNSPLLFLLFLICSSRLTAQSKASQQKINIMEASGGGSPVNMEELMGLEACENTGDEECLKRRIIAEAHLDYIYTQHHKH